MIAPAGSMIHANEPHSPLELIPMPEQLLAVVAAPGREVAARVAGLCMPSDIEITGMQFSHPPESDLWWIQLTVRVPSAQRLELLTKRLNRLVDVLRVVALEPDGHRRQSVYVRLRPDTADLVQVGELVRWFHAETLELTAGVMVLHLTAVPDQCSAFVSMLRPYGVVEFMTTAVSGFRARGRVTSRLPHVSSRFSQPVQ
jgi:acetolactate synthase-1/3 small subunit